MRTLCGLLILGVVLASTGVAVRPASAEFFVDLYAGGATTSNADTTVSSPFLTLSGETQWKASFVGGGRVGFYFEGLPWIGMALDASWFRPEEDVSANPVKLDVVPISVLVMGRLLLVKSPEFPKGRLQPYLGIGPGFFLTKFKLDTPMVSDSSFDVGLDLRAGLNFMIIKNLGVFAEYRFTYVAPEFDTPVAGVPVTTKIDLSTSQFMGGLTIRF
jgi:opacity protein-like surface antigen